MEGKHERKKNSYKNIRGISVKYILNLKRNVKSGILTGLKLGYAVELFITIMVKLSILLKQTICLLSMVHHLYYPFTFSEL